MDASSFGTDQSPDKGKRSHLVIALDYGVMYTAVAWQIINSDDLLAERTQCMVLTDWPKQAGYRVPSEISYSPTKGGHRQWGFDIEPGSEILLGTKLLFDTQPLKQELIPQFPPYDPVEIVTDYLRHVRKWTINSIERQYGRGYIDKLVTDIVYTVPVHWSRAAHNMLFKAITSAGFTREIFKGFRRMMSITELEAPGIYTLRSPLANVTPRNRVGYRYGWTDENDNLDREFEGDKIDSEPDISGGFLKVNDCFVMCDMGNQKGSYMQCGGFQVVELETQTSISQINPPLSAQCGGATIDKGFLAWLMRLIGPVYSEILGLHQNVFDEISGRFRGQNINSVIEDFTKLKRHYTGHASEKVDVITLPGQLYDVTDENWGIIEGEIRIKDEDYREIFGYCFEEVIRLCEGTINHMEKKGLGVKHIFLSGELAESEFLFQRIVEYAEQRSNRCGAMKVYRGENPTSAVVEGAVAACVERRLQDCVCATASTTSFGTVENPPWLEYLHNTRDIFQDPDDGKLMARGHMRWLLRRGDLIRAGTADTVSTQFELAFNPDISTVRHVKFVIYRGKSPGSSFRELELGLIEVVQIPFDFGRVSKDDCTQLTGSRGVKLQRVLMTVKLTLSEFASVSLWCNHTQLSSVELKYRD